MRHKTQRQPRGLKKGDSPSGLAANALFRAAFRFAVRILFLVFLLIDSAL